MKNSTYRLKDWLDEVDIDEDLVDDIEDGEVIHRLIYQRLFKALTFY